MNRLDRMDAGSYLYADPELQLLDRTTARDITRDVREVYKTQKTGGGYKDKLLSGLINVAVAVTMIALGVANGTGFALGGSLGIGLSLLVFGGFQLSQAYAKYNNRQRSEQVHEDATILRLSERVKRNQEDIEMANFPRREIRRGPAARRAEPRDYLPAARARYAPAARAERYVRGDDAALDADEV